MKRVYRVLDRMTDREVALAVMHALRGESRIEQFLFEARVTARLEHPNIMPIYDIGLDETGAPFFTMKLARGESLGRILRRLSEGRKDYLEKYPLDALLDVYSKICNAVACAHSAGVVHLDLKPDNVQVDKFGQVLVCDWGLANSREPVAAAAETQEVETPGRRRLTLSGEISGSPGYMAPEQILKGFAPVGASSDIFALGAILYEILACKPALEGASVEEVLKKTVAGEYPPPRERAREGRPVPSSLEAVCLKAMSFEPKARYSSPEEIDAELAAYRRGFATRAENAGFLKNLFLLLSRHRLIGGTAAVALALIATLASASFLALDARRREAEDLLSRTTFEKRRAEQALSELKRTKEEEVAPAKRSEAVKSYLMLNFSGAEKALKEALDIRPDDKPMLELLGFMRLGAGDLQSAKSSFSKTGNPKLEKYIDFCNACAEGGLSQERILKLAEMLGQDGQEAALSKTLSTFASSFPDIESRIRAAYALMAASSQPERLNMKCVIRADQTLDVSLEGNKRLSDVSALALLPVRRLNLAGTKVCVLTPLRLLPLDELNLNGTPVNSIEALDGMKLRKLDMSNSKVNSLRNVSLPALEELSMKNLAVDDLSPLLGLPSLKAVELSADSTPPLVLEKARRELPGKIKTE